MGVAGFIGCASRAKPEESPSFPVTMPLRKDTTIFQRYVAQIRAIQHIELRALERGYIQEIHMDEGGLVQEGQLLFRILPLIYQAEYQKALAELRYAEVEYANAKRLADSNVVSASELALVAAKLEKAKAEVSLAQAHLHFTELRAPFGGITGRLLVRKGSLVEEGELLTTLSDNSHMWVYFNVPEREYLALMRGGCDSLRQVKLILADGTLYPHEGSITAIESDFNNETGTIAYRATFPNPDRVLRHGQTGTVLVPFRLKGALFIPQKATFDLLEKKYVYVLEGAGKVRSQEVEVEAELPGLYAVRGLREQDTILLEGLQHVHDEEIIKMRFIPPEKALETKLYAE